MCSLDERTTNGIENGQSAMRRRRNGEDVDKKSTSVVLATVVKIVVFSFSKIVSTIFAITVQGHVALATLAQTSSKTLIWLRGDVVFTKKSKKMLKTGCWAHLKITTSFSVGNI